MAELARFDHEEPEVVPGLPPRRLAKAASRLRKRTYAEGKRTYAEESAAVATKLRAAGRALTRPDHDHKRR